MPVATNSNDLALEQGLNANHLFAGTLLIILTQFDFAKVLICALL